MSPTGDPLTDVRTVKLVISTEFLIVRYLLFWISYCSLLSYLKCLFLEGSRTSDFRELYGWIGVIDSDFRQNNTSLGFCPCVTISQLLGSSVHVQALLTPRSPPFCLKDRLSAEGAEHPHFLGEEGIIVIIFVELFFPRDSGVALTLCLMGTCTTRFLLT